MFPFFAVGFVMGLFASDFVGDMMEIFVNCLNFCLNNWWPATLFCQRKLMQIHHEIHGGVWKDIGPYHSFSKLFFSAKCVNIYMLI